MIIFLLLMSSLVFAKKECHLYHFSGHVKTESGKFVLITQKGTRSEVIFEFDHKDIPKLAPYAGKTAVGDIVLREENPISGTKVLALPKINFGVSDPLQAAKGLRKVGKIACPEA